MPLKAFHAIPVFDDMPGYDGLRAAVFGAERRGNSLGADTLGESPMWDHRNGTFYWVDINGRTISRLRLNTTYNSLQRGSPLPARRSDRAQQLLSGQFEACAWLADSNLMVTRFVLPEDAIGFISLTTDPQLLVAGGSSGLFLVDVETGAVIARGQFPERHLEKHRFNDGKVDPTGKLFAGTMKMKAVVADPRPTGSARLYRLDGFFSGASEVVAVGPVTISNGLGWSPGGETFYHIDTPAKTVSQYDFDASTRAVTNKKIVFSPSSEPDGMCVDIEGKLWVCLLREHRVVRVCPATGEELAEVALPGVEFVASCIFGGPGMRYLFITTGLGTTGDVAADTLAGQPRGPSGHLFIADVGVAGMPANIFDLKMNGF